VLPESVPPIGLGTAGVDDPDLIARALDAGYRFVDTAQRYGNESAVGTGLARSDVDREDVFLATKVHERNLAYDDVLSTTRTSLDRLGVDFVDLLYVHWPLENYDPAETLPAFDELRDEGLIRHVGVSNFTPELLAEAQSHLDAPVAANQVEIHPLLPQRRLRTYARDHGVALVAYGPLMVGDVFDVPEVRSVAEKHDVSPARVALAWLLEKDVVPIPRGDSVDHVRDNLAARSLSLDPADVAALDGIDRRRRVYDNEAVWGDADGRASGE